MATWLSMCPIAGATPPPVITSVTVTSFSTGDNHSIALPQTRIPELVIRGTDFFPSGSTGPSITLKRAGYPDRLVGLAANFPNSLSGDSSDGTITLRDVDLSAYAPGTFDILLTRPPSINLGATTMSGAFELKPQSPERLVRRGGFGGPVNKVRPVGNLLYLNSGPRFVILDATNEMSPVELGSIDLLTPILDFQVQGHYAFVCMQSSPLGGGANGFSVVDIQNTAAPQLVWSSRSLLGVTASPSVPASRLDPERIWLKGSFAYISAGGSPGLYIFDISVPTAPVFVRSVLGSANLARGSCEIVGSRLYGWSVVGNQAAYLRVFDLGPGADTPVQIAAVQCSIGTQTRSDDVPISVAAAAGTFAYVTNGSDNRNVPTLSVWDTSNPALPVLASRTPLERTLTGLAIGSGKVFGADEEGYVSGSSTLGEFVENPDTSRGLVVYDIATDPAHPALLSTLKTHGSVYGVDASNSRAYLRDHGDGLIIVDTSNPSAPMRLGGYYSPSSIRDVARNGNLLYVSDQWTGFTVLDISNLDRPTVVGVYRIDQTTRPDLQGNWGIAYRNGKVYCAIGDGGNAASGIHVVDVTDPVHPVLVQAFDPPGCTSFRGLEVSGSLLHAGANPSAGDSCTAVAAGSEFWNFEIDPGTGFISPIAFLPTLTLVFNSNLTSVGDFTFCEAGIVDNSNPSSPFWASSMRCTFGFACGGDRLFIRGQPDANVIQRDGVFMSDISDVTNPGAPTTILGESSQSSVFGIAHNQNGRLFLQGSLNSLVGSFGGLHLLDTSGTPRLLASLTPFNESYAQYPVNGARWTTMLKVFDHLVVAADRAGHYRFESHLLSAQGLVIVEHIQPSTCAPDFNGMDGLTVQDIFDFLNAWFAGDARADFNHLNGLEVQDIFDFLNAWFSGC